MKTSRSQSGARVTLAVALVALLVAGTGAGAWAATPYPMASGPYFENFSDIPNWTDNFASGLGASRWASVPINAAGTIPDGVRITASSSAFVSGTSGGLQRGSVGVNPPGTLVMLSTGTTDNTSSVAADLLLDFTGATAGYLSFDWASVNNSTGDRKASLRVYWSVNGTTFTELPAAAVLNVINNAPTSGSVTVALPAAFDNSGTARLRFYQHNGSGGTTGNRPKIAFDNVLVTTGGNRAIVTGGTWGGTISPPGVVAVADGGSQTFTFTPDAGFAVRDVKVDGVSQGALPSYTFAGVTANHTLAVTFDGGPAGWWPMNQSGGTSAPDASGNGNPATVMNGGAWGAGVEGNALNLASASAQYAVTGGNPAALDAASELTLSAWVKPASRATMPVIVKETNTPAVWGYALILSANSPYYPFFRLDNNTAGSGRLDATTAYPIDGSWMHLAATYDGAVMKLYVNGVLSASQARAGALPRNALALAMGAQSTGETGRYFNGAIDDAKVYGYALDAGEIAALASPWTITASAGAGGSISPSGAVAVRHTASQAYAITPDPGYHVTDVLVDGVSVGAVTAYTFTNVQAGHTISAAFRADTHTITATAGPGGGISPAGAVVVADGGSQTFAITPDAGHAVVDVLVDGVSVGAVTSYDFIGVTADHTIAASFALQEFGLTVTVVGSGEVTFDPELPAYPYGTPVTLTATADPGWRFSAWSGDLTGADNPAVVTVDHETAITAAFVREEYTLGVATVGSGAVTKVPELPAYPFESSVQLTAVPDPGWRFVQWAGDLTGAANPENLVMTGPKSVTAEFELQTFTIAASAGAGGTVDPAGDVAVPFGGSQAFTIAAGPGYHIADVLVDGVSVGPMSVYTFTGVAADHTIHAGFAVDSFTITASAGAGGSISPSGAVAVASGGNQTFTITPDPGYAIGVVQMDGSSVGAVSTYTFVDVTADHTIQAAFVSAGTVDVGPVGLPITLARPTVVVPVRITRSAGDPALMAFSVTFRVPSLLTLPAGKSSIALPPGGGFLNAGGGRVLSFQTLDLGGGVYRADGTTLGDPCGSTALDGTLFQITVGSDALGGSADVEVTSVILRDCVNHDILPAIGSPGTVVVDRSPPLVTVLIPNGGETWYVGETNTITWTGSDPEGIATYDVAYSTDGGVTYPPEHVLATGLPASQTSLAWLVPPAAATPMGRVRVTAHDVNGNPGDDASDADFTISSTFTITASSGPNGAISPSGAVPVPYGGSQTFTVTPDPCHDIADVVVDGVSQGPLASYTFTDVQTHHTIHATFMQRSYVITASVSGGGGNIDPAGAVSVLCGADQSFTITPDACYDVAQVLVDGVPQGPLTSYTFTDVQSDHTIEASFVQRTYVIVATAGPGGAIDPAGNVAVPCGGDKAFTITPDACYDVADVLVDGVSQGPITGYSFFDVQAGHTIEATFVRRSYVIAATVGGGGGGAIDPSGAVSVLCGADQTFLLTPDPYHHVADVLVDGVSQGPITSYSFFDVQASHAIEAFFTLDTYTLTVTWDGLGHVTKDPDLAAYAHGSVVTLAAVADPGWHFVGWSGDAVGSDNPLAVTMDGDKTIHARFEINPPVAPVTNLRAEQQRTANPTGRTTNVVLTWDATPSGNVVEVWRRGFGDYPEYDDASGAVPVASPAYPPGAGWELTAVSASGGADLTTQRDFYYFVAYARDGYGTWSPASALTGGTLNYHLGDVTGWYMPPDADPLGDNCVCTVDVSKLGAHYGITLVAGDPYNDLDVGPTTNMYVDGRPTTDNLVDFEDLVMFAINFFRVSAPDVLTAEAPAAADAVVLSAPERVAAGVTVTATLTMRGGGGLLALASRLAWDPAVVEPVGVAAGPWLLERGGVALSPAPGAVDAAVFGAAGLSGEGELATVTFRALAAGDPRIRIAALDGRDAANRKVTVGGSQLASAAAGPAVTGLAAAQPNPFRSTTALAFSLAAGGPVSLALYSVDGRRVRVLAEGVREAGEYRVAWDGRDDGGQAVAAGVYYAQLVTPQGRFTRTVAYLK